MTNLIEELREASVIELDREHDRMSDILGRAADKIVALAAENDRLRGDVSALESLMHEAELGATQITAERDSLRQRVAELELDCNSVRIHNKALERDAKRYRYFVANKFERYGNGQEHVLYFPAGHQVGHIDSLIDAALETKP